MIYMIYMTQASSRRCLVLLPEAVNKDGLTLRRAELCSRCEGLKERLEELAPEAGRLQQEIATAEEVRLGLKVTGR